MTSDERGLHATQVSRNDVLFQARLLSGWRFTLKAAPLLVIAPLVRLFRGMLTEWGWVGHAGAWGVPINVSRLKQGVVFQAYLS
jgi:hypothetical protein